MNSILCIQRGEGEGEGGVEFMCDDVWRLICDDVWRLICDDVWFYFAVATYFGMRGCVVL